MTEDKELLLELERLRMNYDFSKSALMLLLVLFAAGGILAKNFGNLELVIPVVMIGLLVTIIGLLLVPKIFNSEIDKMKKIDMKL